MKLIFRLVLSLLTCRAQTKKPLKSNDLKAFCFVSGWQDSNLRPPAPKAGAIPGYATSRTWYRSFNPVLKVDQLFVGMAGFEPTTSCSQSRRDTGLRYIPNLVSSFFISLFRRDCKVTDLN